VLASRTRETVAFFSTPKILRPRYPAGSRAASRSAGAYRGAMARLRDALAVARGACERLISARFAPRGCIGCTYAALSAGKRNFVRQRAECARGIRISPNFLLNEDAPAPQRRLITRARARAHARVRSARPQSAAGLHIGRTANEALRINSRGSYLAP